MSVLIEICKDINLSRALTLFSVRARGDNVEWGWEVPKLSKLFAKVVTKKSSINQYGIKSSWFGADLEGHDKAMWIHHFFIMQFVHPYFRPPCDWDFKTPHEHFKHCNIKFLHKKWFKFIKMIGDEDIQNYQTVSGMKGSPKYTLVWLGERWCTPEDGTEFEDNN